MAAIDALSRLPPLKDVETKAQGSTSALQKHREGRSVYQFLRSRPATTTSWDAGLSSAATAERSSHLVCHLRCSYSFHTASQWARVTATCRCMDIKHMLTSHAPFPA
ncbi:hypothetical protein HaLaN_28789 [Haematococcus lacustris]|uniref:Uncharacterized protein n=1 Tax=Haematococcus lacustris TaxID=44745 RepID=A0A6A0AB02_HAELA|nr:hypothetical protein HaLaN_28789 [Haematococcus lacustris]